MRRVLILPFFMAILSIAVTAQSEHSYPRGEVFGGYQFTHMESNFNASGWNASATGNFNRWMGFTADFSGVYKSAGAIHTKVYTYTFGPVVSANHEGRVNPFAHALFGGAGPGVPNVFAMMLGGGVDARVNHSFAIRVLQADWIYLRDAGESSKRNIRASMGVVLRF